MSSTKESLELLSQMSKGTTARASSVLQRNMKLNGPKNALDYNNVSTSWNSDGIKSSSSSSSNNNTNKPTTFIIDFNRIVKPIEVKIQFQAGFVAQEIQILIQQKKNGEWISLVEEEEIEDDHDLQSIILPTKDDNNSCTALQVLFNDCTDFYGRITIYQLQVWGHEVVEE